VPRVHHWHRAASSVIIRQSAAPSPEEIKAVYQYIRIVIQEDLAGLPDLTREKDMQRQRWCQVLTLAIATLAMVTIIAFIDEPAIAAEQTVTVYKTPT
jgi:hypothetical protein